MILSFISTECTSMTDKQTDGWRDGTAVYFLVGSSGNYCTWGLWWSVQRVIEFSPLTWGIYNKPPQNMPECGFVGELCPEAIRGKYLSSFNVISEHSKILRRIRYCKTNITILTLLFSLTVIQLNSSLKIISNC